MRPFKLIAGSTLGLILAGLVFALAYWMIPTGVDTGLQEIQRADRPGGSDRVANQTVPPHAASESGRGEVRSSAGSPDEVVGDEPAAKAPVHATPGAGSHPMEPRPAATDTNRPLDAHRDVNPEYARAVVPVEPTRSEAGSATARALTPDSPEAGPSFAAGVPRNRRVDEPEAVPERGGADVPRDVATVTPASLEPAEAQPTRKDGRSDGSPLQVRLSTSKPAAGIGETIRVDILISGASDVIDVPFNLKYDPSVLQYVAATEGTFLGSHGAPTVFLVRNDPAKGVVYFGLSRSSRGQGASGTGILASVDFQLKAAGASSVEFFHQAVRDSQGNLLPASFIGSKIG